MSGDEKESAKVGRPVKFTEELCEQVLAMVERGWTFPKIAEKVGCAARTLYQWQADKPEFSQAIKDRKAIADDLVVNSLFNRACGYTQKNVKIFSYMGTSFEHEYEESVAPDVAALQFWLTNRRPEEWKNKNETEHKVSENLADRLAKAIIRTETE